MLQTLARRAIICFLTIRSFQKLVPCRQASSPKQIILLVGLVEMAGDLCSVAESFLGGFQQSALFMEVDKKTTRGLMAAATLSFFFFFSLSRAQQTDRQKESLTFVLTLIICVLFPYFLSFLRLAALCSSLRRTIPKLLEVYATVSFARRFKRAVVFNTFLFVSFLFCSLPSMSCGENSHLVSGLLTFPIDVKG